jgi:HTH-type transcriptional regulator / antitoxin HigA
MKAKILKTEAEYEAALDYVAALMDAEPGSPEEEELELFSMLVEQYEQEHYPIALPDPVDAILFRMEQQGLTRKDLAVYIGSQSKVSEVLNRKRPLSLAMIRNLHEGLQIPAHVLLQEPGKQLEPRCFDPDDYPLNEMLKCGYFKGWSGSLHAAKEQGEELLTRLFAVFGESIPQAIYCRRADNDINVHALSAWQACVLTRIQDEELPEYEPEMLDDTFFKKLARASYFAEGPQLVKGLLNEQGIHFMLLPHLPQTYLDGASFLSPTGRPVIGMTLRHDRLDNFWFTLAHELAHVHLHLKDDEQAFFDDIESGQSNANDSREVEANSFAQEMFIPKHIWEQEGPSVLPSSEEREILALADKMEISPAIIAGRIRWESGDYKRYVRLINHSRVRNLFPNFGQ